MLLATYIILLSFMDLVITYYGYHMGILNEINPFMLYYINNFWTMFFVKMGLTIAGVIIIYPRKNILRWIFYGYVGIMLIHIGGWGYFYQH